MEVAAAESSLVGQTLDNKFLILRLIGKGGMGEVYEAEHTTLGKRVAIKLMLAKYMGDGEAIARFTREARAASQIGNPHIIDVSDTGTAPDGRAFVVMELLSGMPLSELIERHGTLPPQRALAIMRQVLRAVGAAHAKGIVHRDLKPDNIFLLDQSDHPDFVKLLDFGISKVIDPDLEAAATKLTTTGVVIGTPLYMAPEQAMGEEISHLADLYACGVILYEMLAGRPPYEGPTYAVLVARVLTTDAPLLSELRPGLAPRLVAAVHRALEKTPAQRHESAEAFVAALPSNASATAAELGDTVATGSARVAPERPGRTRRWPLVAVAGLLVVGVAGAVIAAVGLRGEPSSAPSERAAATTTDAPTEAVPLTPAGSGAAAAATDGLLEIASEPSGAIVIIDGLSRGPTPAALRLSAGRHKIRLELDGYEPVETDEEVTAGGQRSIRPWLRPAVATTVRTGPPRTGPPRTGPTRTGPRTRPTGGGAGAGVAPPNPPTTAVRPPPPPPVKTIDPRPPPTPPTGPRTKPNPYE